MFRSLADDDNDCGKTKEKRQELIICTSTMILDDYRISLPRPTRHGMFHLLQTMLLMLVVLVFTTTKTTTGFTQNAFQTRRISANVIFTKNAREISFDIKQLNNNVDHHEEPTATISVSTETSMEQGFIKDALSLLSVTATATACMAIMPLTAAAAVAPVTTAVAAATTMPMIPSALWAYGHYVSIIAIFGCLCVEKTLVQTEMTVQDENTVVKLDVIYGIMAALLYVIPFDIFLVAPLCATCLFACL
jgi:hypothetical protein